jgi:hypothetical protein
MGRDPRDQEARHVKRLKMLGQTEFASVPPTRGVLPNFGMIPNLKYQGYALVKIQAAKIKKLGEKFVRGITYHIENRYIENAKINAFLVEDRNAQEVVDLLNRFGQAYQLGPGFMFKRAVPTDKPESGLFLFEIWGRLKIYAAILPNEEGAS